MARWIVNRLIYDITLAAAIGSLIAGCSPAVAPSAAPTTSAASAAASTPNATVSTVENDKQIRQEVWDALLIQGSHVGYTHTQIEPIAADGQNLLRITSTSKLTLKRFGQISEQTIEMESTESSDGRLIEFKTATALGPTPMRTTGRVTDEGKLVMTMSAGKNSSTTAIPWSPEYRGMFWAEQELSTRPMQEKETREFRTIVPILNQVATVKLFCRGSELTRLLDGSQPRLMRIESVTILADGNELATTIWVDDRGNVLKTSSETMQQETYRTTEELARTEAIPSKQFDLGFDTMVPIGIPPTSPHTATQARYRVTLVGGNPTETFVDSPQQTVTSTGPNSAELVVRAFRPSTPIKPAEKADEDRPTPADSAPNALIQSDDPQVVALAESVAANSKDAWEIAVGLEKLVHDVVNEKNFTQAFASAAEVARSREGDCSEHAVLLAALLRARSIPARVAAGLVYVEAAHAFGYHMWTEAYINDRWLPLDATLARGGIGAGHLKLFASSLSGATAYSSFLPVAQVLGRLKIELLDASNLSAPR